LAALEQPILPVISIPQLVYIFLIEIKTIILLVKRRRAKEERERGERRRAKEEWKRGE
jgi:hypothetical protein